MGSSEDVFSVHAIRLWKIIEGSIREIQKTRLNLEERLEEWISSDVSVVSADLLIIGRQVETTFGGILDLLCMEENGDTVIIELKRDKTPREIVSQVLDYASWVENLTAEQIEEIAERHYKDLSFEEVYRQKFNHDLPSSINEEHKMIVIGTEIDSSSRRIINYLSEKYGVAINAMTFNYFRDGRDEYLARTFLIEPSKAHLDQVSRSSKRRPTLSFDQLQSMAEEKGVGEIYHLLVTKLNAVFDSKGTTRSSLAFSGLQDGKMNTIFSLIPGESNETDGLKFRIYLIRSAKFFKMSDGAITQILPSNKKAWRYYSNAPPEYSGYEGFFKNLDEIHLFLKELRISI